ncbi:hypothetical protein BDV93DRAFT_565274 [Ceratobasidium sp. AG-I]|nr:hypothetical protein BDV93DRAFT_565274 [Ceratobasidium sp. AG-I]
MLERALKGRREKGWGQHPLGQEMYWQLEVDRHVARRMYPLSIQTSLETSIAVSSITLLLILPGTHLKLLRIIALTNFGQYSTDKKDLNLRRPELLAAPSAAPLKTANEGAKVLVSDRVSSGVVRDAVLCAECCEFSKHFPIQLE